MRMWWRSSSSGGSKPFSVRSKEPSVRKLFTSMAETETENQVRTFPENVGGENDKIRDSGAADVAALTRFSFGFAFRDATFADRTLELIIIEEKSDDGEKKFEDVENLNSNWNSSLSSSSSPPQFPEVIETKSRKIPVNSLLLAAKSDFFFKLFTNGMQESKIKDGPISIQISAHEEPAMMELLSVMYQGRISDNFTSSFESLIQLLIIADKFLVKDCVQVCGNFLSKQISDVTPSQASIILDLSQTLQSNSSIQTLTEPSQTCLVDHFGPLIEKMISKSIRKTKEEGTENRQESTEFWEFLGLSSHVLKTILESDELKVSSEKIVFESVLEWLRFHFPENIDERKRLLEKFSGHIRFEWISPLDLKDSVLNEPEMNTKQLTSLVLNSLASNAERFSSCFLNTQWTQNPWNTKPRNSYSPPEASILLELPLSACRLWTDPSSRIEMQPVFVKNGVWITLDAYAKRRTPEGDPRFCVYLRMHSFSTKKEAHCKARFTLLSSSSSTSSSVSPLTLLDSRPRTLKEFVGKVCKDGWGFPDFFNKPWREVVGNPSFYFPDGVMRLHVGVWAK